MPIPTYDKFIDPMLRYLAGQPDIRAAEPQAIVGNDAHCVR
jgi:hypothetical protein